MITKEWKNIEGYEKFYKVSNYGEVKAKRRVVYDMIDGELQPISVTPEHLITPTDNGKGYKIVGLIGEDKKRKNYYVHRLVATAFIPNPHNYPQVNHLDYDRANNKITNLEWCTASDNAQYSSCNHPLTHDWTRSSTGYKYIQVKRDKYRVSMPWSKTKRIDKCFKTFEEALNYRNMVAKEIGIEIRDNNNELS